MMRRISIIPCLLLLLVSINGQALADQLSGATEADAALSEAVIALRAATVAQASSGSGDGYLTMNSSSPDGSGRSNLARHHITFIFRDSDSLLREYAPSFSDSKDAGKMRATLYTKARAVYYIAGYPSDAATQVVLDQRPQPGLDTTRLANWSYSSLFSLPSIFASDKDLFGAAAAWPGSTITRKGDLVDVICKAPFPAGSATKSETVEAVFDMNLGGAIRSFTVTIVGERSGQEQMQRASVEMEWRRQGTLVVPVKRTAHSELTLGGKEVSHAGSKIEIDKFTVHAVAPDECSVAALRIPDGTTVIDAIHRKTFAFVKGAEGILSGGTMADDKSRAPAKEN